MDEGVLQALEAPNNLRINYAINMQVPKFGRQVSSNHACIPFPLLCLDSLMAQVLRSMGSPMKA